MAEEHKGGGPVEDLFFIVGVIVVLVILWFATGGPKRADLRGIFLHPPAPLRHRRRVRPHYWKQLIDCSGS